MRDTAASMQALGLRAKVARLLVVVALGLTFTGCSQILEVPYPDLSSIKRLGDGILSKAETDQAIKDLENEQKKQQEEAKKRLETP